MNPYFNVIHHIDGRIRLRVSPHIFKHPVVKDADHLLQQAKAIRGIQQIRLNLAVRSVVIQYDPSIIKPSAWEQWLQEYGESLEFSHLLENYQA